MSIRIKADESVCIGSGQCVITAPEVFTQRPEDGLVHVLDTEPAEGLRTAVEEAVERCPSRALTLE